MFFIVESTWDLKDEAEVTQDIKKLCVQAFYRQIGNPWPKLFYVWHHPKEPKITTLWESSGQKPLADLWAERTLYKTEMTHVRQIFPPYVDIYQEIDIKTATE